MLERWYNLTIFFFGADEPDSEVPAILPVPEIYKEIWLMLTYIKFFFGCSRVCLDLAFFFVIKARSKSLFGLNWKKFVLLVA